MIEKEEIYIEVEGDLDEEIVNHFTEDLEKAINVVMREYSVDSRPELLTVLSTFAAQVAHDLELDEDRFISLSSELYQEIERLCLSEKNDKSQLN